MRNSPKQFLIKRIIFFLIIIPTVPRIYFFLSSIIITLDEVSEILISTGGKLFEKYFKYSSHYFGKSKSQECLN